MSRSEGVILPLGIARFNGLLEFKNSANGVYMIVTTVIYGENSVNQTLPIRVSDGEDGKIVEVIDLEEAEGTTPEKTGGTTSEKTGGTTSESSEDAEAEAEVN